jgi:serine protease Do
MTKLPLAILMLLLTTMAYAVPEKALIRTLGAQVLRVQVGLANGGYGVGSGVVIAKNQVVTNCHVVANALTINVINKGESVSATAIRPDWHHDICVLTIPDLDAPAVKIGSSKTLKYEQSVFTVGYPGIAILPSSTFGVVKGLYPMDGSVVIRATSTFKQGASGGGVFDDSGNLVGIITLKSPGRNAFYYNMPVEWLQAALKQPEQPIVTESKLPFWAQSEDQWPFFMRIVYPLVNDNWDGLRVLASAWAKAEPANTEAWFYLAAAEYLTNDTKQAESHLQKVMAMNSPHSGALEFIGLIAKDGDQTKVSQLAFDKASQLKLAMGISIE